MRGFVAVLAASLLLAGASTPGWAQDLSDEAAAADLQDLADEPSRAELFERTKAGQEAANPQAAADATRWFNLYGPFRFPNDAIYDLVLAKPRVNSIFGVDISHYTPDSFPIESLARKKIRFAYLKATQGTQFKDGKFGKFWKRLDELPAGQKVHRGAYHFLSANTDGAAQAATFMSVLKANGGLKSTDMPPVLDLEWDVASATGPDRWKGKTADQIIASVKAWASEVKRQTGRTPMIYTSRVWWRERVGDESKYAALAQYPIWIADYSKSSRAAEVPRAPNSLPWTLWQYTSAATMASGFTDGFDANIFKGSETQFYLRLGVKPF